MRIVVIFLWIQEGEWDVLLHKKRGVPRSGVGGPPVYVFSCDLCSFS